MNFILFIGFIIFCASVVNVDSGAPALTMKRRTVLMKKNAIRSVKYKNRSLLPTKKFCGMQHSDEYDHDEKEIAVDEFPWLVQIECISPSQKNVKKFTGVLISNKYILTSQKCLTHEKTEITLGKHNKANACVMTRFKIQECPDPEQKVTAAESHAHPNGTFVLMRINKRITFTDYIRPICLSIGKKSKPVLHGKIVSSGWDKLYEEIEVKKKIFYEVVNNDQCNKEDTSTICTRRITNQDVQGCTNDKGTPVMYKHKRNWYVTGILDPQCQSKQTDATKLINENVVEWIFNKIHN